MRIGRRGLSSAALAAAFVVGASQTAFAASGGRDTSFGGDGLAAVNATSGSEQAYAVAVRNSKIVVAGYGYGPTSDVVIARFDMNGTPDTTFGGGDGVFVTDLGGSDEAGAIAILADESIVATGYIGTGGSHYSMFVLKLTPAGVLDSSFGTSNGVFISDYGYFGANGYDLKVLSSGKIVVAGSIDTAASDAEFALFRFTAKGKPDPNFGGGDGLATLDLGVGTDEAWQLQLVANGNLLVGGWRQVGTTSTYDVALARFTGAGALDTTFGNGGSVDYDPTAGSDYVQSMIVTGNKIVIMLNGGSKVGIMRLKMSGKKDTTFGGGDGLLFRNVAAGSEFHNIAVDSNGRFVLAGVGDSSIMVARLKSTYAIDTSFGNGGHQTAAETGYGFGLALQPDGKILVSGRDSSSNIAVARFLP